MLVTLAALSVPMLIAPHGEFSPGALAQKAAKKAAKKSTAKSAKKKGKK